MYAVIKTGGRQQKVRAGDVIEVDYMDVDPGSAVEFRPLMVMDDDGKAHYGKSLGEAKVVATLVGDKRDEKIRVFKYRPKTGYRRTQGHRQMKTVLTVQEVALSPERVDRAAEEPAAEEQRAGKKAPAKKAPAKKAPAKKAAAKKPAGKKAAGKKAAGKKAAGKKRGAKKSPSRKSTGS